MQMLAMREEKSATNFLRVIHSHARTYVARNDKTSRPHRAKISQVLSCILSHLLSPGFYHCIVIFFGLAFLFTRNTSTWEVRKTTKITSSRLALPVSGPSHKDCDATYMLTAFSCTAYIYHAYLTEMGKEREHRR